MNVGIIKWRWRGAEQRAGNAGRRTGGLRFREDAGEGKLRKGKTGYASPHQLAGGHQNPGEGPDFRKNRHRTNQQGNQNNEIGETPKHHSTLRNYINSKAIVSDHGVRGKW